MRSADFWTLLKYARGNGWLITAAFLAQLMSNIFSIAIPIMLGKYYQLAFDINSHRSELLVFFPASWTASIRYLIWLLVGLFVLKVMMVYLAKLFSGLVGEELTRRIRLDLFEKQLNIPIDVYQKKGIGKYLLRYSGDMQSMRNYFVSGFLMFFSDSLFIVIVIPVLFMLSWQMTLLFLLAIGFFLMGLHFLNDTLRERVTTCRNHKSNLLSFVNRTLINIVSIEVFNKKPVEFKKYLKHSELVFDSGTRVQYIQALFTGLVHGLTFVLLIIALVFSYYVGQSGVNAIVLLVTIMLIISMLPIVRRLLAVRMVWEKGAVSLMKLKKVLKLAIDGQGSDFVYNGETILLNFEGFDPIRVNKGFNSFFLPNSGAELVDKLTGLKMVSREEIKIGQLDLHDLNVKSWRRNIAVIDSRFPLIGSTVYEAVTYSRKPKSWQRSEKILGELQQDISEEDRLQLDQYIGDQGCLLSPAKRKLLQIVRALVTRKSILVIRDYSTDLSEELQLKIDAIIRKISPQKVILVITDVESKSAELLIR